MSRFPDLRFSQRIWDWLQAFSRTASPNLEGVTKIQQREVYILPTRLGLIYAVMLLAMLFGSNNYGSNPGFLFTFLLAGLGMAALFQTWKNLVGIELIAGTSDSVFCGKLADFQIIVRNPYPSPRAGIKVNLHKKENKNASSMGPSMVDLGSEQQTPIVVSKPSDKRGILALGRVVISTSFPLGLFRAWTYARPGIDCLIYPQPSMVGSGIDPAQGESESVDSRRISDSDFAGHNPYQPGDNMMHVDWKVFARGKGLHLKNFDSTRGNQVWLRWHATDGPELEQRISQLTRALLDLDSAGIMFGLELPPTNGATVCIEPDTGPRHRRRCLEALARFGTTNGTR